MLPPVLRRINEIVAQVRRRLALRRAIRWGSVGLQIGLLLAVFTVFGLAQVIDSHLARWIEVAAVVLVISASVLSSISLGLLRRRLQRREVALLLDQRLQLDEAIVTATWLAENPELPNRASLLQKLSTDLPEPDRITENLPYRLPRHLKFTPLLLLLLLASFFAPPVFPALRHGSTPATTEPERLEQRLQSIEEEFSGVPLPEALETETSELLKDLSGDELPPEEAVKRIEDLQRKVDAFVEDLKPSKSVLQQLEQAAEALKSSELPDLSDALRDVDLDRAADALEQLSKNQDKLTPAQKQSLGEQLTQAGEELSASQEAKVAQAGEAMKQAGQQLQAEGATQGPTDPQGNASKQKLEQLRDQLHKAQEVGKRLQQDKRAMERAQRTNGALESSKQRLGGKPQSEQGQSSQQQQGGKGKQGGTDEGGNSGKGTNTGDQGSSDPLASKGGASAHSPSHTWEDQSQRGGGSAPEFHDKDRNSDRVASADQHIDDFERLYEAARLKDVDPLIASVDGQIDEHGHLDILPTRRTGAEESATQPLVNVPSSYTDAAKEAIANETVPPGYRRAVKTYFDQLE